METTTYDVRAAADELETAIKIGKIPAGDLANLVMERIEKVRGVNRPIVVDEKRIDERASGSWKHTWIWPL